MGVCLRLVETIVSDRFFFTDLSLYVVKNGNTRQNLPSNGFPYSWQTQ